MKNLKKFLPFISCAMMVLAIVMFFLPFVGFEVSSGSAKATASFSGFQAAFGAENVAYSFKVMGVTISGKATTKLVAVDLVAFILVVLAAAAWVVNFVVKTKFVKIIKVCIAVMLVVAGVLMFTSQAGLVAANEINENAAKAYSIGAGAVIGGIFALLGGCAECAQVVLK